MEHHTALPRVTRLGLDLGSANVKLALCAAGGEPLQLLRAVSQGQPLSALAALLQRLADEADPAHTARLRVAVTGVARGLLRGVEGLTRVNEVVATAEAVTRSVGPARTIIDLGAQFSKWILLEGGGSAQVVDFATNGLCAAGCGAFLEQQASRLQLSVEQLGQLAAGAAQGATIAGRCSVFAKSDMIHLQQKGTPPEEIALGLCQALVRTFLGTVLRGHALEPPVALVGGGAASAGLVRALGDELGLDSQALLLGQDPFEQGALGAALLAGEGQVVTLDQLLDQVRSRQRRGGQAGDAGETLAPLELDLPPERDRPAEDPGPAQGTACAFLGVDVGSVSTNLALIDASGEVLLGVYLPTRGQPVAVLEQGLQRVRQRFGQQLQLLGVGTTGSGRHLAAQVLGADVVHNEITAQLTASARYLPEVDTVFEIGGQDSKFISVRSGHLADFEMNKICAAGTGSFLEEQAERLGVNIVEQFAQLALAARSPVDLGTRCTVFMDAELVRSQQQGTPLEDLCAGLAYSVARNYLEKVVAGRSVGQHVMFQGGTASNAALVAAFCQLLGRQVQVHPYNRISGALGAALLARRSIKATPRASSWRGLDACGETTARSFECPRCENRCQVNRLEVSGRVVHFGDACERYTEQDRHKRQQARPFEELFAARQQLLREHTVTAGAGQPMGLALASLGQEYLPMWSAFLAELGFSPVIGDRTTPRMLRQHGHGVPPEICLPIKAGAAQIHHLLAQGRAPRVFVPAMLECPPSQPGDQSHTCVYTQQLGDMLRLELGPRLVSGHFSLTEGVLSLVEPLVVLAQALERTPDAVARALRRAREAQAAFDHARVAAGSRALAATFRRAVVVLGRPYNTHDPLLNLSLARHLDRVGLPAIPLDMMPLATEEPLAHRWRSVPWHFSREQLRALRWMRRDGRLFPLFVSSYGCGPDGFIFKHFEELLAGRPRLLLEFDEHRAEAGLVTRLEAFSDEIDAYLERHGARPADRAETPGPRDKPLGHRFYIPNVAHVGRIYVAGIRAAGFEAEELPPLDAQTVRLGEQHSNGRECHPWTLLTGELIRLVRQQQVRPGDVFLSPGANTSCLLRQYGDAHRILLERVGQRGLEVWDAVPPKLALVMGQVGLARFYHALAAGDLLYTLGHRLRAYEAAPGAVDHELEQGLDAVAAALEQRRPVEPALRRAVNTLWELPHRGRPGTRPVVGVTGDLYTRIHPVANAGLFRRLERMGCEVWPSPYFAGLVDLSSYLEKSLLAQRGQVRRAAYEVLAWAATTGVQWRLARGLPAEARALASEPAPAEVVRLAEPFVGRRTNYLVLQQVAKLADFLARGAAGAINAAGLNCMVATAAAAAIPAIRAHYGQAPVIDLAYGGSEGPAQRIRLETFVHQVRERWQQGLAQGPGARRGQGLA